MPKKPKLPHTETRYGHRDDGTITRSHGQVTFRSEQPTSRLKAQAVREFFRISST